MMSLVEVTPRIVKRVQDGEKITQDEFVDVVSRSLPRAWEIVSGLVDQKRETSAGELAQFAPESLDDGTRGELLRMMASNAIRGTVENHFGMTFGFQNCHTLAAFYPETEQEAFKKFISIEAQILNQSPEMRDC